MNPLQNGAGMPALLAASVLFGRILSGPDEAAWGLGP